MYYLVKEISYRISSNHSAWAITRAEFKNKSLALEFCAKLNKELADVPQGFLPSSYAYVEDPCIEM